MKITLKNNDCENKANDDDIKDHNVAILNEACRILGCVPGYLIKNIERLVMTNKEYSEVIARNNMKKHEKQPTEYEYVKVEFDEIAKYIQPLNSGIYQKLSDSSYSELSQIADLYTYRHELYRRIELTPEQLHERKVEELARAISKVDDEDGESEFNHQPMEFQNCYKDYAKAALEWMESKGK